MFSALIILILLPFIVSVNYYNQKGYTYGLWTFDSIELYRYLAVLFMLNFVLLGWLGGKPVEPFYVYLGLASTFFYFLLFFLVYRLFIYDKKLFFDL
jgi:hypothetical protein